jgi:hypothetical protein
MRFKLILRLRQIFRECRTDRYEMTPEDAAWLPQSLE